MECGVDCPPVGDVVRVSVSYITEGGQPRTAATEFGVPMCLVCRSVPPVKDAAFKITLDTNK